MRALALVALAPFAAAQTLEVAPQDAPVVLDGRCETGVPMPRLALEGAEPVPMPALGLEDGARPVPMPNLCGDPIALALEGGPPAVVLEGPARFGWIDPRADLEAAAERLRRALGLERDVLEDAPPVAPPDDRP